MAIVLALVAFAMGACNGAGSPDSSSGASSGSSSGSRSGFGSGSGPGSGSSSGAPSGSSSGSPELDTDATIGDVSADGGGSPIEDESCPPNRSSITTYAAAAAPVLSPLDPGHSDPLVSDAGGAPPAGWNFYQIDGAICRDGSPMGIYVRYASMTKLMVYFEGGGLCFSSHFCDHNPANMLQQFSADPQTMGQTVGGSLANLSSPPILQKPWSTGIFDVSNEANPVKDWSQIYIPYCTGMPTSEPSTMGR